MLATLQSPLLPVDPESPRPAMKFKNSHTFKILKILLISAFCRPLAEYLSNGDDLSNIIWGLNEIWKYDDNHIWAELQTTNALKYDDDHHEKIRVVFGAVDSQGSRKLFATIV